MPAPCIMTGGRRSGNLWNPPKVVKEGEEEEEDLDGEEDWQHQVGHLLIIAVVAVEYSIRMA